MSRQDEPNRCRRRPLAQLVAWHAGKLCERVVERLARDASFVCVFASPPQAVVLLCEVRELEIEAEGPQDESLLMSRQRRRGAGHGAVSPGGARLAANRLDELEEPRPFLLDEHGAENRPEQAHVAAKRRGRIVAGLRGAHGHDATSAGRVRRGRRLRRE